MIGKITVPEVLNTEENVDLVVFCIVAEPNNILWLVFVGKITLKIDSVDELLLSTVLEIQAVLFGENLVVRWCF